jgi:hypothetical protein
MRPAQARIKEFIAKKESGSLTVSRMQQKFAHHLQPVELTKADPGDVVKFDDKLLLWNHHGAPAAPLVRAAARGAPSSRALRALGRCWPPHMLTAARPRRSGGICCDGSRRLRVAGRRRNALRGDLHKVLLPVRPEHAAGLADGGVSRPAPPHPAPPRPAPPRRALRGANRGAAVRD